MSSSNANILLLPQNSHYLPRTPIQSPICMCCCRRSSRLCVFPPVVWRPSAEFVVILVVIYSKIVELEEELRVVGNNLKSLEVSEEKALQREDSYEDQIRSQTGRLKEVRHKHISINRSTVLLAYRPCQVVFQPKQSFSIQTHFFLRVSLSSPSHESSAGWKEEWELCFLKPVEKTTFATILYDFLNVVFHVFPSSKRSVSMCVHTYRLLCVRIFQIVSVIVVYNIWCILCF